MKKSALLMFLLLIVFGFQIPAVAEEGEMKRAIITFEEGKEAEGLKELNGIVTEKYEHIEAASVTATEDSLEGLKDSGNIKSIEEDIVVRTNDQVNGWAIPKIQTQTTWQSGYSGKGIKIAVIDSGIAKHPDLKLAGGISVVDYTTSYNDDSGHGTHVAGLIGALDNSIGIKGVAPGASLYAVKVFYPDNTAYLSDVIKGIDWAITNRMDIINLSLGSDNDSSSYWEIIKKANSQGILVFAAAGNKGMTNPSGDLVEYPARYPEVIAVSAVDQYLKRAVFSSGGPAVDVAAPGTAIYSTFKGESYAMMSGTSMATPFVTGQAALLKEAYPTLTSEQLRSILLRKTIDLGPVGKDPIFGQGLLQGQAYTLPEYGKTATLNPAISLESSKAAITGYERTIQNAKVMLILKNGQKVDVTANAKWISQNEGIASASKGLITLKTSGKTKIVITYGGYQTEIDLTVEKNIQEGAPSFSDVPSNYWAFKEIEEMKAKNIINGYPNFTYKPENNIRRDHVALLISKAVPMEQIMPFTPFPDIPTSYVYYNEIKAVQQAGIFSGNGTGFNPMGKLKRANMAKVLVETFNLEAEGSHPFPDVSSSHWANNYINVLYQAGITTGSQGKFRPEDEVTRAEFAVFMSRAFKYYVEKQ
ncbi:S8 family peptidase [Planococcus glaciei]|uniref:S8 family peptidase n=1 Tax=Planococcus glaciei TaxID=459472 RepID=UPI001C72CB30|nr:S8 family serine peptidase [Planococcus glaciei]MBX0316844.1 S8 family serine peptidase [Planococcus glaciei]